MINVPMYLQKFAEALCKQINRERLDLDSWMVHPYFQEHKADVSMINFEELDKIFDWFDKNRVLSKIYKDGKTIKAIAAECGKSTMYISNIKKKAMDALASDEYYISRYVSTYDGTADLRPGRKKGAYISRYMYEFGLNTREAVGLVRRGGIYTEKEYEKCTREDLLKIRNLGVVSVDHIIEEFKKHGFVLKKEEGEV